MSMQTSIDELGKEAFVSALYSALFIFSIPNMPAASGNCGKGGGSLKWKFPPSPKIASSYF